MALLFHTRISAFPLLPLGVSDFSYHQFPTIFILIWLKWTMPDYCQVIKAAQNSCGRVIKVSTRHPSHPNLIKRSLDSLETLPSHRPIFCIWLGWFGASSVSPAVENDMQQRKSNTHNDFVVVGALVDKTGQYFHVFYACAVVVASAGIFLIVSFRLLDRKSSRAQGLGESPGRTEGDVAPDCLYKSVPTEGDKEKASPSAAEYSTSIWTCRRCIFTSVTLLLWSEHTWWNNLWSICTLTCSYLPI